MLVCILTKVKRQNYFSVSSGNVSNKGVLYRMKAENNKSGKESCKKKGEHRKAERRRTSSRCWSLLIFLVILVCTRERYFAGEFLL
jgi:hypothetical protein